jgi:predicted molibdopterin-dependent oxidoreductase YjgC
MGARRGEAVSIVVDGVACRAYRGETVAAALLANGRQRLRLTRRTRAPRGVFCGMGICFDCVATINGVANVRSCMTRVEDGMTIVTGITDEAGTD